MRRQAHDPLRRGRQFDATAGVIALTDLRLERRTDLHAKQHQPAPGKPLTAEIHHRHVRPPE